MPERMPCLVPYCRRTRRDDGRSGEWICGPHWSAVPARARNIYGRARSALRRAAAVDAASYARLVAVPEHWLLSLADPLVTERLRAAWRQALAISRCRRLWAACRRRAIEAAGGTA